MSESKKPREFWVRKETFYHNNNEKSEFNNAHEIKPSIRLNAFVHVIEKSAYDKQKAVIEELFKILKRRCYCGYYGVKTCVNCEAIAKAKRELGTI